jgi:hypothetical protein
MAGGAAADAAGRFPDSVYPPPVAARAGGALGACPNPAGLERFNAAAAKLAARIAGSYGRRSLSVDLRGSDRAWWPQVRRMWRSGKPGDGTLNQVVYGTRRGPDIAYAAVVRYSCGAALTAKSLTVGVGPRQTRPPYCSACRSTLFFVDRRGRALLYYLY